MSEPDNAPLFRVIYCDTGDIVNLRAASFTEIKDIDAGIYREVEISHILRGKIIYTPELDSELRRLGFTNYT